MIKEWLPADKSFLSARVTRLSHTLASFHNTFRQGPRRGTELWFVRVVGITQRTTHPLTDDARVDHEVAVQRVNPTRIRRPVWPQLAALNSHVSGERFSIRGRVESQAPPRCSRGVTNSGGVIMASSLVRARVTKHLYQAPEDPRAFSGGYIRHHLHHHAY